MEDVNVTSCRLAGQLAGRALHWYRRGLGFESRTSLNLFGVRTLDKCRSCLYAAILDDYITGEGWDKSNRVDSLQPSTRFFSQDGGCNSRTKDYLRNARTAG